MFFSKNLQQCEISHQNKFAHYQISQIFFPKLFFIIYLSFPNDKKNSKNQYIPHLVKSRNYEIINVWQFSTIG
jgi:hypothetical protein